MNKKVIRSWVLYDWANSSFATIIMAAVMPIFFSSVAAVNLDPTTATAYWGYVQSISLVVIVLIAPVLGAIADQSGSRRKFLQFFTWMGAGASLLMATIGEGEWIWASVLMLFGSIGFSAGNIFYDAYLTDICPEEKRDSVSSAGYAWGYIGGGLLLALCLGLIQFHDKLGLSALMATQISFLSVGVWWLLFSIPIFRNVPDPKMPDRQKSFSEYAVSGFSDVAKTIRRLHKYPELLKFLIAFWFFSDGINTIIKMATIYGTEIGIAQTDLIAALLITQFVGIPFTFLFGRIAEKTGSKPALISTLIIYLIIVILGYFMTNALHFYLLAVMVGFVQGGSQALSRSIFSRLVPPERNNEFFGFYGLSGKFASIFGPAVFGLVGQLTGSSRAGIASLALFFVVGIILLLNVDLEKGKTEAVAVEEELEAEATG
ncbi:MFS transporter [Staphylospora marina]|uniref:MFS transporter n=1 Tax=Staphylospora marina TaxID=2490858 RepID=UPI000F5BE1B4|nr:MFS transporter [Staphylospora marina]